MKKFISVLMAALMLFSFASCKGSENEGEPDAGLSDTEILEAFYTEYYSNLKGGKLIKDFDDDGTEDMLVCTYEEQTTGYMNDFSIRYIKVKDNKANEIDLVKFSSGVDSPYGFDEYIGLYMNADNQLLCNMLCKYEGTSADYMLFSITENKLQKEAHLLDPGYTSGIELIHRDDYFNNYDSEKALYGLDPEATYGKYSSYEEALDAELGVYGFSWKLWDKCNAEDSFDEKYVVAPTEGIELIFEHKNY